MPSATRVPARCSYRGLRATTPRFGTGRPARSASRCRRRRARAPRGVGGVKGTRYAARLDRTGQHPARTSAFGARSRHPEAVARLRIEEDRSERWPAEALGRGDAHRLSGRAARSWHGFFMLWSPAVPKPRRAPSSARAAPVRRIPRCSARTKTTRTPGPVPRLALQIREKQVRRSSNERRA